MLQRQRLSIGTGLPFRLGDARMRRALTLAFLGAMHAGCSGPIGPIVVVDGLPEFGTAGDAVWVLSEDGFYPGSGPVSFVQIGGPSCADLIAASSAAQASGVVPSATPTCEEFRAYALALEASHARLSGEQTSLVVSYLDPSTFSTDLIEGTLPVKSGFGATEGEPFARVLYQRWEIVSPEARVANVDCTEPSWSSALDQGTVEFFWESVNGEIDTLVDGSTAALEFEAEFSDGSGEVGSMSLSATAERCELPGFYYQW